MKRKSAYYLPCLSSVVLGAAAGSIRALLCRLPLWLRLLI